MPRRRGLFAHDAHAQLRGDISMQTHGHAALAKRLDGLIELHATPLDLHAVLVEKIHEVLRCHRTEKLALFGGLPALLVDECLDLRANALGVGLRTISLGVRLVLDVLEVLQIACGGAEGELLRNQKVPRVPIGDIAHLAPTTDLAHIFEKDDLHGANPSRRTAATRRCAPA